MVTNFILYPFQLLLLNDNVTLTDNIELNTIIKTVYKHNFSTRYGQHCECTEH